MKAKVILLLAALVPISSFAQASPDDAVKATNALAVKLMAGAGPGNVAFSPYSAQMALAMAYLGAEGGTRAQMATALQYPRADMAASFASLQNEIQKKSSKITLLSANRLFAQSGYPFRLEYLAGVKKALGSELQPLDFHKPHAAAHTINAWVEEKTRDQIKDLLSADDLRNARLVLANAVYFRAVWQTPFKKEDTRELTFYPGGGKKKETPTMTATEQYGLAKFWGFRVVTLPYANTDFQLVIFLPDKGRTPVDTLKKLDPKLLRKCAAISPREVSLFLPRFKLDSPVWEMSAILKKLGMPNAFDEPAGSADFGAMVSGGSERRLFISDVVQKCVVEVAEEGTKAAAATVVFEDKVAIEESRSHPPEVHVDRPFLFAIQHRPTGAVLFLGRVTDPSK